MYASFNLLGTIYTNHIRLTQPNMGDFSHLYGNTTCPQAVAPPQSTVFEQVHILKYSNSLIIVLICNYKNHE